jgi:hypothetical protein
MLSESRASKRRVLRRLLFIAAFQSTLGNAVIGQEPATISDVGEWAWDLRDGESIDRIFKYDGLFVSGELLLQDYRDARAALKPSLQADESPSLLRTLRNPKDANFGLLTLRTVYSWDRERGRVVYLQKVNGTFKVVGVSYWIA